MPGRVRFPTFRFETAHRALPYVTLVSAIVFPLFLWSWIRTVEEEIGARGRALVASDAQAFADKVSDYLAECSSVFNSLSERQTQNPMSLDRLNEDFGVHAENIPEVVLMGVYSADVTLMAQDPTLEKGAPEPPSPTVAAARLVIDSPPKEPFFWYEYGQGPTPFLGYAHPGAVNKTDKGLYVAVIDLERLFGTFADNYPALASNYIMCLEDSDEHISVRSADARGEAAFAHSVPLAGVLPGLRATLIPRGTGVRAFSRVVRDGLMTVAVLLCAALWLLSRDVVRRVALERELRASQDDLRALAAHQLTVREQERTRLARDIHDELGRAMTALKVGVAWLQKRLGAGEANAPAFEERLLVLAEQADDAARWVKKTAAALRPKILDDFGLVAALEAEGERFRKQMCIRCVTDLPDHDIALDGETATALFRICQESLTNVVRYANATRATVRLERVGGALIMTVADNGIGIDEERAKGGTSLGILGMRERARRLGGALTIVGVPGEGTTVRVTVPYDGTGPGIALSTPSGAAALEGMPNDPRARGG